jgi:hypothetical protein
MVEDIVADLLGFCQCRFMRRRRLIKEAWEEGGVIVIWIGKQLVRL